jgi:hypothetical protein
MEESCYKKLAILMKEEFPEDEIISGILGDDGYWGSDINLFQTYILLRILKELKHHGR